MFEATLSRTEAALVTRAEQLGNLTGWRRWLVAGTAGLLSALAMAPFFLWPILLLTIPALIVLLDSSSNAGSDPSTGSVQQRPLRSAAATGWWFGFGFHLGGLYWIAMAFLVDAAHHAWLIPFAMTLMPGGLALFTMAAGLVYVRFSGPWRGWWRLLDFALVWMVFEWLRGNILTGFPWNLPGYTWGGNLAVAQTVSVVGIYGLSLLTVLLASVPAALLAREEGKTVGRRILFVAFGLLFVLACLGGIRLGLNGPLGTPADVDGVRLRLVQPSIPQAEKWKPENAVAIVETYLEMTGAPAADGAKPTLVIWPESALPLFLQREDVARKAIGRAIGPGAHLLTGAVRKGWDEDKTPHYYNSFFMLDSLGVITGTYDKYHLVPFGEYLPARDLLGAIGLQQLVSSEGDGYTPGLGPHTLSVPGTGDVLPMVCYEVIFPGRHLALQKDRRPDWIVNVTNDAWYGNSTGPRQHLTQARFRAIEEGLPLIRSANTGISAVVDARGRIRGRLALEEVGVLDSALPGPAAPTLYSRFGDSLFALMMIFTAIASWTLGPRPSRSPI